MLPVAIFILGVPLLRSIAESRKGRNAPLKLHRWWLICCFMFIVSLLSGLLFGFAGVFISRFPFRSTRHSAHCKLLSKGVELRSSKTCRYGDLSSVSHRLFGSPDPVKFRCKLDYYWTSVFKVEYHADDLSFSGTSVLEVPSETLPSSCRPTFADSWRLKESLKVNGSYPCMYSGGSRHVVELESHALEGKCVAESPSTWKLFRDYVLLILSSYDAESPSPIARVFWGEVNAVVLGFAYSVIVTLLSKAVSWVRFKVFDPGQSSFLDVLFFQARLQLSCLILVPIIAKAVSIAGVEELRLGLEVLTGINFETTRLRGWLRRFLSSR